MKKSKLLKLLWKNFVVNLPALFSFMFWVFIIIKMIDVLNIVSKLDEPFMILGIMIWAAVFIQIPSLSRIIFNRYNSFSK